MAEDNAYHLTEGLWISAAAPDRVPLTPLPGGGGGSGFGGWGLSEGRPRGTGGPNRNLAREISARRVLDEERQGIDQHYAAQYAPLISNLVNKIAADRERIRQQADALSGNAFAKRSAEQQQLTSFITATRKSYLSALPEALSFYGAVSFYKRSDSMMTRIYDPGVFTERDEAFANELWKRMNNSIEGAYKLHLHAITIQSLSDGFAELAAIVDQAERSDPMFEMARTLERRTLQLQEERRICFECLPNFLQNQLVQATPIEPTLNLTATLSAYKASALSAISALQTNVPAFSSTNPEIVSPLSKPQLEALQHLTDEQRLKRAGPLWAEYHRALALNESVRYLQRFTGVSDNLIQRALEVEQLQEMHAAALKQEAARQEETRQRNEAQRLAMSFNSAMPLAASWPLILPIGKATFAITASAYTTLQAATTAAVTQLANASLTLSTPLLVGALSLLWPSSLGNSERRYLISIPVADLTPPGGPDLTAMATSAATVDLPYVLSGSENSDQLRLFVEPGGRPVPVRAATFDTERQVYSLALDNPQRILTWTPASAPGLEQGGSAGLPAIPPGTVVYTGSILEPVSNESGGYSALDLFDQERLVITFPIDSGLPPILLVFSSPRYEPGVAIGSGEQTEGLWLGNASTRSGVPVPVKIAEQLKGREFRDFNAFRRSFWKSIANDPELSEQFSKRDLQRMKKHGYAPIAPYADRHKSQTSYALHHAIPISENGGVYDMDNLRIVTPAAHNTIHYGGKQ
ncbi:S-type pyocin domain-containing protein [Pseudomonas shirazensis]|uniref:S-type pyocin domain-containing protein n=1 Tax=Pseudomonas shirazensis TaxID=2745494 RepID=UPI001647B0A6|nr:S-type pyocin domain-containing protein [Pseudomonas shirazensis]MBV4502833.1 S-type pyocin domain-containing protein [Pseudomonas shirazensis]